MYKIINKSKKILADIVTPVSIYMNIREIYPHSILLESSDYHGNENSYSFICMQPLASFVVHHGQITTTDMEQQKVVETVSKSCQVVDRLQAFVQQFKIEKSEHNLGVNGVFGYAGYDAVQYFETIQLMAKKQQIYDIPELRYSFYKYIIAINHYKNEMLLLENLVEGEASQIDRVERQIYNRNYSSFKFKTKGEERSNVTDDDFVEMVKKGKQHCFRGDVFQLVLSRQFSQGYEGDEFNLYRALRSINPSPYLFFFDYGDYQIFGSSPEAQVRIKNNTAIINPIAGTFKRTGDASKDLALAEQLKNDPKENAEHVMLVDLARNDLSRCASNVQVDVYREVQFYSHVIHLVSTVSGELHPTTNIIKVMADTFPAGTLSGAPKYKAMQLIDRYENQNRGFYGGGIGVITFDGDINHAILIRSFLSKNNTLFYQAGAGIVSQSDDISEMEEVKNKLMALKKAILLAEEI